MKNLIAVFCSMVLPAIHAAGPVPVVSGVSMEQDGFSRTVEISYSLDAPAVVTVDILTNGVSVGAESLRGLSGDVNRLVAGTEGKITWKPYEGWQPSSVRQQGVSVRVKAWATNAPPAWMVVDLLDKGVVNYYVCTNAMPNPDITADIYKTDKLLMRKIPARFVRWRQGAAQMDVKAIDTWAFHYLRFVTLTQDYYIGVYPVTQRQYELMMTSGIVTTLQSRPSLFRLESDYKTRPVDSVSFEMIRGSNNGIKWPNEDPAVAHGVDSWTFMHAIREWTGLCFDLPTEAQWEFAARGGEYASSWYWGEYVADDAAEMNKYMRYGKNYGGENAVKGNEATCTADYGTAKVGTYLPNAYGLYDMFGNVREWCLDFSETEEMEKSQVDNSEQIDPAGATANPKNTRIVRGGGYTDSYLQCNASYRNRTSSKNAWSQIGFRLAVPLCR